MTDTNHCKRVEEAIEHKLLEDEKHRLNKVCSQYSHKLKKAKKAKKGVNGRSV